MGKSQEYKALFEKIDQEDDGEIYLKEVVMFLRAVNEEVDANMEVRGYEVKYMYVYEVKFMSQFLNCQKLI